MTLERKILLILLELTALALLFQLGNRRIEEQKSNLEEKINLNRQLLQKEEERGPRQDYPHKDEVISLYDSFEEEMDIYAFGRVMKDLFARKGINLTRYREIDSSGGQELEYQLEGSPAAFMDLLHDISVSGAKTHVSSLRISSDDTGLDVTLRIAPALLPEGVTAPPIDNEISTTVQADPYHYSPRELSGLFPRITSAPVTQSRNSRVVVPDAPSEGNLIRGKITYIGQVKTGNKLSYCFKLAETGEILLLPPGGESNGKGWSLKEVTESSYLLQNNSELYEVYK